MGHARGCLVLICNMLNVGCFCRGLDLSCEQVGDARRKIWIESLKETKLGMAPALFDHWKIAIKTEQALLPAVVRDRSQNKLTGLERPAGSRAIKLKFQLFDWERIENVFLIFNSSSAS